MVLACMPLSSCGKTFLINLESPTKMGAQWSCKTFFPAWDTASLEARRLTPSYVDPGDMNRLFPSAATRCSSLRTLSLGSMLELGHGGQVLPGIIF